MHPLGIDSILYTIISLEFQLLLGILTRLIPISSRSSNLKVSIHSLHQPINQTKIFLPTSPIPKLENSPQYTLSDPFRPFHFVGFNFRLTPLFPFSPRANVRWRNIRPHTHTTPNLPYSSMYPTTTYFIPISPILPSFRDAFVQ